jgi:hypothetical protein
MISQNKENRRTKKRSLKKFHVHIRERNLNVEIYEKYSQE